MNTKENQKSGCFDSINFDELEAVFENKRREIKEKNKILLIMAIFVFFLSLILFIIFGYNFWSLIFLLSLFYLFSLYKKEDIDVVDRIAEKNNLIKERTIPLEELKGNLFKVSWEKKIDNVIAGSYEGKKARFFNYKYIMRYEKKSVAFRFTVLEIFLKGADIPYMLLHYKRNLPIKGIRHGVREKDERKVVLEKGLDEHYDLFIKDGYGAEAMQIFREEFLNFLLEEKCKFSIEIKEDRVYIYLPYKIKKPEEIRELFVTASKATKIITPQIKRLKKDFAVLRDYYKK